RIALKDYNNMEPLGQVSGASFTCPICQKAFSIRKLLIWTAF
ncbi:unnamed protein product, partial [Clonostachys rhizophaga]